MRAALDPNGADAYWAGRFGLIPLRPLSSSGLWPPALRATSRNKFAFLSVPLVAVEPRGRTAAVGTGTVGPQSHAIRRQVLIAFGVNFLSKGPITEVLVYIHSRGFLNASIMSASGLPTSGE